MEITFIVWLWQGWRSIYSYHHVNTFVRALSANLTIPHRVVCVTDQPEGIMCETHPLWEVPEVKDWNKPQNCFFRLRLFDGKFAKRFGDRIVSADIDNLILDNIDDFFTGDEDFKILSGYGAPYNGGLFMLKAGAHQEVWDRFISEPVTELIEAKRAELLPQGKKLYGSDQAWIGTVIPDAATWPRSEGWVGSYRYGLERKELPIWKRNNGMFVRYPEHEARAKVEREFMQKYRFVSFAGGTKPWSKKTRELYPNLYRAWEKYSEGHLVEFSNFLIKNPEIL